MSIIFYKNQTVFICGSMSHVMEVNHYSHFLSAYHVLRFGVSSSHLLFLIFTIMLKERVPGNKPWGGYVQAVYRRGRFRTALAREWGAGLGRERSGSDSQLQQRPWLTLTWSREPGWPFRVALNWGKEAVPLYFSTDQTLGSGGHWRESLTLGNRKFLGGIQPEVIISQHCKAAGGVD